MREYTTQMDAARKGIITPELTKVAEKEHMREDELLPLVAEGKVVIPANKLHTCLNPEGIGSMLQTKINVNLGISRDCKDYDIEMKKVMEAVNLGAHAIMDLSSHGNTEPFRKKLIAECPVMVGTVPIYDSVIHYQPIPPEADSRVPGYDRNCAGVRQRDPLSERPGRADCPGFY